LANLTLQHKTNERRDLQKQLSTQHEIFISHHITIPPTLNNQYS